MIGPGDLVMVVRGHECALGATFVVDGVEGGGGCHVELSCDVCGWISVVDEPCAFDLFDATACPTWWLIRIDPGSEIMSECDTDEVPA